MVVNRVILSSIRHVTLSGSNLPYNSFTRGRGAAPGIQGMERDGGGVEVRGEEGGKWGCGRWGAYHPLAVNETVLKRMILCHRTMPSWLRALLDP